MQLATPGWANKGGIAGKQALNTIDLALFLYFGILHAILTAMKETTNNSERGRKHAGYSRGIDTGRGNLGSANDPLHHYRGRFHKVQRPVMRCDTTNMTGPDTRPDSMVDASSQEPCQVSTLPPSIIGYVWGISSMVLVRVLTILASGDCLAARGLHAWKDQTKREYLKS